MNLTANFTLDELIVSPTAVRHGIDNTPGEAEAENLRRLCELVLQPLRDLLARPIVVTSGYRCPELNRLVGGAKNSAHLHGLAADILVPGMTPREVCLALDASPIPFHKAIEEFGQWTHVAAPPKGIAARLELLTARRVGRAVTYTYGLEEAA